MYKRAWGFKGERSRSPTTPQFMFFMKRLGRVHWLLHNLPIDFKNKYRLEYDYVTHNYIFYRNYRWSILDCFIIVRTSRKCFRCMYYNRNNKTLLYFSRKTSIAMASEMYRIYKNFAINSAKK